MAGQSVNIPSQNGFWSGDNYAREQNQSSPEEGELATETEDLFTISFAKTQNYIKYGESVTKAILQHLQDGQNHYHHKVLNHPQGVFITFSANLRPTGTAAAIPEVFQMPPPLPTSLPPSQPPPPPPAPHFSPLLAKILSPERPESPEIYDIGKLFCIDTTPETSFNACEIPSYDRTIKVGLMDEEFEAQRKLAQEKKALKRKFINTCFNCGKVGHGTRSCNLPLNQKRIQEARKAQPKVERYCDIKNQYSHLKPGVISQRLRRALGLRNNELPFFFYRMRILGYPPGWLEDSKVEHSGIKLFNDGATESPDTKNTNMEESANNDEPCIYNMSQIISFPGYNQYPGKKFIDAYAKHNVPPFDPLQSKKEFIKGLGGKVFKGYKWRKLNNDTVIPDKEAEHNIQSTDMEIANSDNDEESMRDTDAEQKNKDLLSEEAETKIPDINHKEIEKVENNATESVTIVLDSDDEPETVSLSLSYLEQKQDELLRKLEEITSIDSNTSVNDVADDESTTIQISENNSEGIQEKLRLSSESKVNSDGEALKCDLTNTIAVEKRSTEIKKVDPPTIPNGINRKTGEVPIGTSTDVHMGTPILKFTPYESLPQNDNFKVGVSDVINFENLSNSTGKYVQMQKVLQKVRTIVSTIKNNDLY